MKKMDTKTKNLIFAVVILSIMLIASIVYNILGGFVINQEKNAYLNIGDDYTFNVDSLGVFSQSFCIDGTLLPGDVLNQKIQIKLPDIDTNNKILRVKVQFLNNSLNIYGFDSWVSVGDYYVYNSTIYKNQTIGLCEKIELDKDIPLKSNMLYYLIVSVEYINELGLNK